MIGTTVHEWPGGAITLTHYDFQGGERHSEIIAQVAHVGRTRTVVNAEGKAMLIEGVGLPSLSVTRSWEEAPHRLLQEHEATNLSQIASSPDGRSIVALYPDSEEIVAARDDHVKRIHARWWITHPLSWSPDSSRVAFYFAKSGLADDVNNQEHGVAVLTNGGELSIVRAPSKETATPKKQFAKAFPIGWDPLGQRIYFSEGRLTPDHFRYCVTIEFNLESGANREIFEREFCDISPDGSYLIAHGISKEGMRDSYRVDLKTLDAVKLPSDFAFSRISPSGRLAACLLGDGRIACVQTGTWEMFGEPLPKSEKPMDLQEWVTRCRWITRESTSQATIPAE